MGITFTSSSPTMIYSNYPENIEGDKGTGNHYTIEANITAGTIYTVFLYHWNVSSVNRRIGVALKNVSSSPLKVTYYGGGILVGPGGSAVKNCATLGLYTANGSNGTSLQPISSLAAGACAFMADSRANMATSNIVVSKFKFKASQNAKLRVFHCPPEYTPAQIFASTFTQDAGDTSSVGICGSGVYCEKKATINTNTTTEFPLFEYHWGKDYPSGYKNTNEYQHKNTFLTSSKPTKQEYIWGNYEITYTLTLQNSKGKTLKISPENRMPVEMLLVYTSVTGAWKDEPVPSSGTISIPLSSTSNSTTVKLVLPGGNNGQWSCSIE